jgi:molecular chaperone GrpE
MKSVCKRASYKAFQRVLPFQHVGKKYNQYRFYSNGTATPGSDNSQQQQQEQQQQNQQQNQQQPPPESKDVAAIEAAMKAAQEECKSIKSKLAYALADIDNVRKIAKKDVSNAREYAIKEFAKDLLDVADSLERGLGIFPAESKEKSHALYGIREGIEMTSSIFNKVFEKHGVTRIPVVPKETEFDPNFHNALFHQPVPNVHGGIVCALLKTGYMIKNRVLRPSEVGVAAENPDMPPQQPPPKAEGEKQ